MSNIGFIGLGIMGRPMAGHLIAGGHTLFAYNRSPVRQELIDAGARACASPAEVARQAEIIITMVPDTPDVEAVLFEAGSEVYRPQAMESPITDTRTREDVAACSLVWKLGSTFTVPVGLGTVQVIEVC